MNEHAATENVRYFFLSSIKKLRKTLLGEGGGGRHPPLLYVRVLVLNGFLPRLRKKADEIHKALFLWKLVYTLNFLRIT